MTEGMTYDEEISVESSISFPRCVAAAKRRVPPSFRQSVTFPQLNHGRAILETREQLDAYLAYYGEWHDQKFKWCLPYFPHSLFEHPFDLTDWGCGEGIGELSLSDFLGDCQKNLKRITLIEPSAVALSRAELHARKCFPDAMISRINKRFEDLFPADFGSILPLPKIHFFSNVLDLPLFQDFDSPRLSTFFKSLRSKAFGMDEYFLCVSPVTNSALPERFTTFANGCYDQERWYIEQLFSKVSKNQRPTICAKLFHFQNRALENIPFSRLFTTSNPEELLYSAAAGNLDQVTVLVERGVDVDYRDGCQGMTPLMYAAKYGFEEVACYLLEKGAQVDARNEKGATALYFAAKYGEAPVVRSLLEAGADTEISPRSTGYTPFLIASKRRHQEIANLLQRAGCDIHAVDRRGRNAFSLSRLYAPGNSL